MINKNYKIDKVILFAVIFFLFNDLAAQDDPYDPKKEDIPALPEGIGGTFDFQQEDFRGGNWSVFSSGCVTDQTCNIGSPWNNTDLDDITRIAQSGDYTREKGWRLIDFNFGIQYGSSSHQQKGQNSLIAPWFMLYNKYRNIFRIFVHPFSDSYSRFALEVTVDNASNVPGVLSRQHQAGKKAANKYLNNDMTGSEKVYMVSGDGASPNAWMMFEFRPDYAPNIENNDFTGASFKFTLWGIDDYNINLNVDLEGTTSARNKSLNLIGSQETTNSNNTGDGKQINIKDIINGGAKFSQKVKVTSVLKDYNKAIGKLQNTFDESAGPNQGLNNLLINKKNETNETSTAWKVAEGVDAIGNIFPVAKTISEMIGIFSESNQNSSGSTRPYFIRRVTKTSGTISGSMKLKQSIQTMRVKVPGVQSPEYNPNNNVPYYNCPLGRMAFSKTPVLHFKKYDRKVAEFVDGATYYTPEITDFYKKYISISPKNSFNSNQLNFNSNSDLKIIDTSVSIMAEIPLKIPVQPSDKTNKVGLTNHIFQKEIFNPVENVRFINNCRAHANTCTVYEFSYSRNFLNRNLKRGVYHILGYDDKEKRVKLSTKYVHPDKFKNLAFNVPYDQTSDFYVRTKIVYRTPNGDTILSMQNHQVDLQQGSSFQYNKFDEGKIHALPPYSNYHSGNGLIRGRKIGKTFTDIGYLKLKLDERTKTYNNAVCKDVHAIEELNIKGGDFKGDCNYSYTSGEKVTITPGTQIGGNSQTRFYTGIKKPLGKAQFHISRNPSYLGIASVQTSCSAQNTDYYRTTAPNVQQNAKNKQEGVTLYPNPAKDRIYIKSQDSDKFDKSRLLFMDMGGKVLFQKRFSDPANEISFKPSVEPGVYVCKIITNGQTYIKKIVIR